MCFSFLFKKFCALAGVLSNSEWALSSRLILNFKFANSNLNIKYHMENENSVLKNAAAEF